MNSGSRRFAHGFKQYARTQRSRTSTSNHSSSSRIFNQQKNNFKFSAPSFASAEQSTGSQQRFFFTRPSTTGQLPRQFTASIDRAIAQNIQVLALSTKIPMVLNEVISGPASLLDAAVEGVDEEDDESKSASTALDLSKNQFRLLQLQ